MRSKAYGLVVALTGLLGVYCSFLLTDPVVRFSYQLYANPMWLMGMHSQLQLPVTATAEEIVAQEVSSVSFPEGKITSYHIVRVEEITLAGNPFSAVLLETNLGKKIVLYRHGDLYWSVKIYDAP